METSVIAFGILGGMTAAISLIMWTHDRRRLLDNLEGFRTRNDDLGLENFELKMELDRINHQRIAAGRKGGQATAAKKRGPVPKSHWNEGYAHLRSDLKPTFSDESIQAYDRGRK